MGVSIRCRTFPSSRRTSSISLLSLFSSVPAYAAGCKLMVLPACLLSSRSASRSWCSGLAVLLVSSWCSAVKWHAA